MVQDPGDLPAPVHMPHSAFERASQEIERASEEERSNLAVLCSSQPLGAGSGEAAEPARVAGTDAGSGDADVHMHCAQTGMAPAADQSDEAINPQLAAVEVQPEGGQGAGWGAMEWPGAAEPDSAELDAELMQLMNAAAAGRGGSPSEPCTAAEPGPGSSRRQADGRAALPAVPPHAYIAQCASLETTLVRC